MSLPQVTSTDSMVVLELRGLRKAYGPTQALVSVDLSLRAGAVHGIVGENGAGKSTLVKILSGVTAADGGEILIYGRPTRFATPAVARANGISTVFQELTLIPDLSVAENMELQRDGASWTRARRQRTRRAGQLAEQWGLSRIDLSARVGSLSLRERQLVEILCAVGRDHRVLILDEPSSALLPEDTQWLASVIRRVTARGTAVLFISHMLDEVERFCDEVFVQRNGSVVAHHSTVRRDGLDRPRLIEQMIGRSLDAAYPPRSTCPQVARPVLSVTDLSVGDSVHDVSLEVGAGEVVGVVALDGQGQAELFRALAGDLRSRAGRVVLDGARLRRGRGPGKPGQIAFLPPDRKTAGTVLDLSVRKNISLPILSTVGRGGVVNDRREEAVIRRLMDLVEVDPMKIDHPVRSLSGGNQQKVAFARAASSGAKALLLYDPTRGVDVGTKYQLYALIRDLATDGGAILYHSTEIPEIVNVCHRAVVVYGGRIVAEYAGDQLTEQNLMTAAIGLAPVDRVPSGPVPDTEVTAEAGRN